MPKKKQKIKPKKAKVTKSKDRLQLFYDSLDFISMWEKFQTAINENGTQKYRTVWSFIKAQTKQKWQRDFLYWILGPLGKSEEYKKYDQFNWEQKRVDGFWYNTTNADKLQKSIQAHGNALDSLREVGKVNVEFIERLMTLAKEIDREYLGRLFLPSLSQKENSLRANTYFRLLDQLQTMMNQAQIMFGRTQGMDLERLDEFFKMFGQGMGQAALQMGLANNKTIEGNPQVSKATKAITAIAEMIAEKSAAYELDLPDKDMEAIVIDAASKKPSLVGRPQ